MSREGRRGGRGSDPFNPLWISTKINAEMRKLRNLKLIPREHEKFVSVQLVSLHKMVLAALLAT